ncbi:MAG: hypothetical protein QOH41_3786, partial [Blastocatellia bacterium]|nr:hypothetical protein [Blastocatellia bacterium]
MNDKPSFFSELKRRNVYKVAVAYAVVGWLLVQVATQVFPFFEIPNWAVRLVVLLIIVGFPISLVIAWAFEMTPEGIKRTEVADAEHEHSRGKTWIYVVIVGAGISIALFFLGRYTVGTSRPASAELPRGEQREPATIPEKSIAVLPFDNLSSDKENAYFAEGIQDEILTKLATVADLKVISRTSTAKYASKPDNLKAVSQQLGAAKLLEGTVQRVGDKVRVNVQLIDAPSDSHLWAKSYDGDAKDVFNIESKVAQEVADSLQAKLSPNEADTLASAPTKDPEAYDSFLKGEYEEREAESGLKAESFDRAAAFYQEALNRDPKFALAAAGLAESRTTRHWFVSPLKDSELAEVKKIAEHALALAPDLAEAHIALGTFYYYGKRQYDDALTEFRRALDRQPNNVKALEFSGYVYRRQGQWERCLSELEKCEERDPRNAVLPANIGTTYCNLRMWQKAKQAGLRALALDPHNVVGMRSLYLGCLNGTGDTREARRLLQTFPPDTELSTNSLRGGVATIIGDSLYLDVIERNFAAALKGWDNEETDPIKIRTRLGARAAIHVLAGDIDRARDEVEKARTVLEERVRERPNDGLAMTDLSWVNLALKRNDEALQLAHRAADLLPVE